MKQAILHSSLLPLQGGINFRDLGGYKSTDGRKVKSGLLFRAGALNELTPQDTDYLSRLGVVHILDYRDADEIGRLPDVIWQGAQYNNAPANPISEEVSADLTRLSNESLSSFKHEHFMLDLYRKLPFDNKAYHELVALLQQPSPVGIVQHCAIGKDRTGIGVALLLFALGVDYNTIMQDYLLTNTTLTPFRSHMLNKLNKTLSAEVMDKLSYVFSARQEFLEAAIFEIEQRYNSVDNWLEKEFGLNNQKRQMLQEKYLIA